MKRTLIGTSLVAFTSIGLMGCGADNVQEQMNPSANGAANSDAIEQKSGSLTFYTSQPDADAEALVEGFNEAYPDIDVSIFRSGTEEVVSRILAENEAGAIQADVLLLADSVTFEGLKEYDLLMPYESSEINAIPSDFIDPDHMYTGTKIMPTVLAYNTNLVQDIPTSWDVLTSQEAFGKTTMPSPLYSGAAAYNTGVLSRTDGFGWEFFEALSENEATIVQGNGGVVQAVAGGDSAYGMVVDFVAANAQQQGSPIDLIYPEEGVPVITEPIGITAETENEEAAKAFIDFVLSAKGQELSVEIGYTPIRDGVAPPEGLQSAADVDVLSSDLSDLLNTRESDKEQFRTIFGDH